MVRNPVLRGDLRARGRSHRLWLLTLMFLGVTGALVFLGLPPEVDRFAESQTSGLYVAVLWVEVVLVSYGASACLIKEIAIEGEKSALDLVFAPFPAATIVAGKSASSLATIVCWLALAAPLLVLTTVIRQVPWRWVALSLATIAVMAWGIAQIGLLYDVLFETEFSRTLAHWGTLLIIFIGTAALPPPLRAFNPIAAATAAAEGIPLLAPLAVYAGLGAACAIWAYVRLRALPAA
jgi:ABC-type transport system involved in cytochrome c biogenesis permease component